MCAPKPARPMASDGGGPGVNGADAARAGHQRGRLVAGHLQALGQADVVALLEGEVRALPADQPQDRDGQAPGRPGALEGVVLQQQVLGQREEPVPGQDGRADAEHGPGRRPVPALGVVVHDVVVQQGEVVHELDRHRGGHAPLGRRASGAGGEQGQRGPQGLAATAAYRVTCRHPPGRGDRPPPRARPG